MIKKRGKEIYQPPYAQDLSGFSANGQVKPMGYCTDGSNPVTDYCTGGALPLQDPSSCNPTGSWPAIGGCTGGLIVAQGCSLGSVPT
jgi:hypothetical protein